MPPYGRRGKTFQFTPLREGRQAYHHYAVTNTLIFQFTPLREGRQGARNHPRHCQHFNSRPSARGDNFPRILKVNIRISIHAPPRGATEIRHHLVDFRFDFNSRPSARGDRILIGRISPSKFQFTPLREGRRFRGSREDLLCLISIHAPPRGATLLKLAKN